MLHSDIQLLLVTPKDQTLPIGGVSAIFDRNLNTNTVLGMDEGASQSPQFINRLGLPALLPKVAIDVNLSSGTYDEAYAIGTMRIRYAPDAKHSPGVLSQGTAVVTIHAHDLHSERRLHSPQCQHRPLIRADPLRRPKESKPGAHGPSMQCVDLSDLAGRAVRAGGSAPTTTPQRVRHESGRF